jgi:hypothetical protein
MGSANNNTEIMLVFFFFQKGPETLTFDRYIQTDNAAYTDQVTFLALAVLTFCLLKIHAKHIFQS